MVDVGLFISYILIGVCVLTAVGMPLVKAFGDPDSLKKMGIGVGALVVVFLVSYLTASGEAMGDASVSATKMVGAGLTTFYILAIAAIGGIVYTEIKKAAE
ncbi:MAG: hypothetical protein RLN88_04645 [Ekhidna sp.]|uniref:hypothetical protein n=1 Tax=Ekhidna sp. TaxID=2608089 RepID=UPI0032EE1185